MYTCVHPCIHHGKYLVTDYKTFVYVYICTFFPISVGKYMGSRGKDMTAAGICFSVIGVCCGGSGDGDNSVASLLITVKFVG